METNPVQKPVSAKFPWGWVIGLACFAICIVVFSIAGFAYFLLTGFINYTERGATTMDMLCQDLEDGESIDSYFTTDFTYREIDEISEDLSGCTGARFYSFDTKSTTQNEIIKLSGDVEYKNGKSRSLKLEISKDKKEKDNFIWEISDITIGK